MPVRYGRASRVAHAPLCGKPEAAIVESEVSNCWWLSSFTLVKTCLIAPRKKGRKRLQFSRGHRLCICYISLLEDCVCLQLLTLKVVVNIWCIRSVLTGRAIMVYIDAKHEQCFFRASTRPEFLPTM
jgi:hypothetical protein